MSRPILTLPLLLLLLAGAGDATARTVAAKIARVTTAVATMEGVELRLHWPQGAQAGELSLRAARVDAPDLGYAFRDLAWRCPLSRDGQGGWRCDGALHADDGKAMRLAVDLGAAHTDAALSQGTARLALRRNAATPDDTMIELTGVPLAWAQALAAQAWAAGRLNGGSLDGRLRVHSPQRGPLRVAGALTVAGAAVDTADGAIAAEGLDADVQVDYRRLPASTLVTLDGDLDAGEMLFGSAYVSLASPVHLEIAAMGRDGEGWEVPAFAWRDGDTLVAEGSAAFGTDADLRELEVALRSADVAPLPERYLSGWLGVAGLSELSMQGALDATVSVRAGALADFALRPRMLSLAAADGRFRFDGLDGDVRIPRNGSAEGELRWQGGGIGQVPVGAVQLPWRSADGELRLRRDVTLPLLGGSLAISAFRLRPPSSGEGLQVQSALELDGLDLGALAQALGLPAFGGTLGGRIPLARYADERLDFEGGLSMRVFDGDVRVSELSMERPFGVAPTLSADLDLAGLDLMAITGVFDFGSIGGRLHGHIHDLRLVDWEAQAFDAELHTERRAGTRQRISQRAVQNISSVGDASFVSSLQGRLIGLFDDFGYRRIGISCRLANGVCVMDGLHPAGEGFAIVEGAGVPRLDIVGYNRRVDWQVLVERLAAVGSGDVAPVFE